MNLEKKYNDLVNEVLIKRTLYYEAALYTAINENTLTHINRCYYYNGMLRILVKEAKMFGITLKYNISGLAKRSWRDVCSKG